MRPIEWDGLDRRLWATDWWTLFPEGDGRRRLTWMNRFGNISNAVNIYSSGEEVLNNNDESPGHLPYTSINVLSYQAERIWIQQEMTKGGFAPAGAVAGLASMEIQGGWGYNTAWGDPPPTVAQANTLTEAQLRAQPFFERFNEPALMDDNVGTGSPGSNAADEDMRADLLGSAIPALSFPAGRNPVPSFTTTNRNRDLMSLQDGWPASRLADPDGRVPGVVPYKGRWFHSDIKNIAYPFNYRAWDLFTAEGNLR
jgi:hypothetical protein